MLSLHQTNALEFEICFNRDFSLFIMFFVCFFFKMKSLNSIFIIWFYIFSNMHRQIKIHVRIKQWDWKCLWRNLQCCTCYRFLVTFWNFVGSLWCRTGMIKAIIVISGVSMSDDQFLGRYSLLFTNAQMSQWKKCRFFGL